MRIVLKGSVQIRGRIYGAGALAYVDDASGAELVSLGLAEIREDDEDAFKLPSEGKKKFRRAKQ